MTLEDGEEQEDQTDNRGQSHGAEDDPSVNTIDGNAKQGDADGELGHDAGNHVENLTKPPALYMRLAS